MIEKDIINTLLAGGYIQKRTCRRKGYNHALYNVNQIMVCNLSDATMRDYSAVFKHKKGRATLNLNLVRQQHGNSLLKSLYKQSKKKKNAAH